MLLLQDNILDVLMNFLALTILTELDDYLFETIKDNPISKLIADGEATICGRERKLEDIVKIETTTADQARYKVRGNRIRDRNGNPVESTHKKLDNYSPPSYIYIPVSER